VGLQRAGRLAEAERLYLNVVAGDPKHADAWFLLGALAMQSARIGPAAEYLARAVALRPDIPAYLSNYGEACRQLGRPQEAEQALRRAVALAPDLAEPCFNLGILLEAVGSMDEAVDCYSRAANLKPDNPAIHFKLAGALQERGDLERAVAHYERAIALNPNSVEALVDWAGTLRLLRRLREAVALYRRAIAVNPGFALAYNNLGATLLDLGDIDDAIAMLRRAIELLPGFAGAHSNLGKAFQDAALLNDAIDAYRAALAIDPDFSVAHSNLVFVLPFHPRYDAAAILKEARAWNTRHGARPTVPATPHANEPSPNRRLRVGYVSPDFKEHCQAHFMLPLLRHHNHDSFEIVCYSSVRAPDAWTARLREHADLWRELARLDDAQVAQRVRADGVDVLVDLTMHMAHGRLKMFAHRPAPVQMCWLAYPGTTGLDAIDYRITDPYLDPPNGEVVETVYAEETIRLADTFWCYDPCASESLVGPLPAERNGFVTFGQFNNFTKVNEEGLVLWARVLRAVARSRLLLLAPLGSRRQWIGDIMKREGVVESRLEFVERLPRTQYLARYHDVDICLDCVPYNGHTTSLDAFWMGVPVVTRVGRTVVGRAGLSQAMNLGLGELVAQTSEDYVRIAAELAADFARLAALRGALRDRMERSPLMDARRFAGQLESAYRCAWRRWCERET
jgi:predicted O-linked N-acetylglucosamine transferase (SPINDLY family)